MPTYKFDLNVLNKMLGTYLDLVNLVGGGIGLATGCKLWLDKNAGTPGASDYFVAANGGAEHRVITVGGNDQLHIYDGSIDFLAHLHKKIKGRGGADGVAKVYVGLAADGAYTTIASALAALPAAGGVVEILPGYTETITSTILLPADNVAIICPTRDAVITDNGAVTMFSFNSKSYCGIHGIKFVGNGSTSVGINGPSSWCHVSWCWFHDCKYAMYAYQQANSYFHMEWCYFTGFATWALYFRRSGSLSSSLVENCFAIDGAFTSGFLYLDWGMSWNTFRKCFVLNCGAASTAFYLGSRGSTGTLLDRCYSYRNGTGFNLKSQYSTASWTEFRSCVAYQNYYNGFVLGSTQACSPILTNCIAVDNSYTNNNTYSGFVLGNADRAILQSCKGYQISSQQKYGFEIGVGTDKAEIRGGVWYPNQTASWLDGGTDTIIDARDD